MLVKSDFSATMFQALKVDFRTIHDNMERRIPMTEIRHQMPEGNALYTGSEMILTNDYIQNIRRRSLHSGKLVAGLHGRDSRFSLRRYEL